MKIAHLLLVIGLDALEDEQEHLVDHIHDLVVVVLESHLEVETGELGQVPVGVGILSPEDGANFVDALHISGDGHLLSQLRGLCQERWPAEVVDFEDGGTRLGGSGLEFGRLDLGEALGVEEGSEEIGDTGTDTEDGTGDWSAEVDNSVGETCGLANARVVGIRPGELCEGTAGILDLEWKRRGGSRNHMKLQIHRRMSQMKRGR